MGNKNGEARKCCNTNRASIEDNRIGNIDMNIVAKPELNFYGVILQPVNSIDGTWLTASQIGFALQYADDKAVQRIYSRRSEEFTEGMTRVVKVTTLGGEQLTRVFSLRGAHLIAMFARTPVAKEFRRWVLNILDREVAEGKSSPLFSGSVLLDFEGGLMTRAKVAQPGESLISMKTMFELMQMNGYVITTKEELKGEISELIEKLQ